MNFVELYFIVIYRFIYRPSKNNRYSNDGDNELKFQSMLFTCFVFCMNTVYFLLLLCYIFFRHILILITLDLLEICTYILLTFTILLGYLWFYRLKDVNLMEQRYLQLSRCKRRAAIISVVLLTVMTFFVTGFFFINKKVLPNL